MNITTLHEPASTDGYKHSGDGTYFLQRDHALQVALTRHGGHAVEPLQHSAVETEDGRFLLLKSATPVSIEGTQQATEDIVANALKKLTPAEIAALGLNTK